MADENQHAVPEYLDSGQAQLVAEAESALIGVRPEQATALAISGGGIRSASFALGVMQALVNGKVLPHVHYLSTVSGGGYLGSALTWFLRQGLPDGRPAGTTEDDFPFGVRQSSRTGPGVKRNQILDYIRQHACYLAPTDALGMNSFLAVVLRAMVISLAVYFAVLTAVMFGLKKAWLFGPVKGWPLGLDAVPNRMLLLAVLGLGLFVLFSLVFSLATRFMGEKAYGLRTWVQSVFGRTLHFVLGCAVLGTLPLVHHAFGQWVMTVAGSSATFIGALLGFFEFLKEHKGETDRVESPGPLVAARPVLAAALVLYGLALGAYGLTVEFTDGKWETGEATLGALIAGALVVGLFVNINYLGLHRMYRDRLMELFLPDAATVRTGKWALAREADCAGIDGFGRTQSGARLPYHIINTNVVLVDSPTASYRGRGGDSFIVSRLYCGSEATGWRASSHYMKRIDAQGRPHGRGMTLPTAMAISGAAVNPNAGVGGRGTTRARIVSTLLALLNLRLGYWAPNPRQRAGKRPAQVPNFFDPGLRGGVLSGGLHEHAPLIELSDGGHFENLAVYELIRRRVRCIFVCDGGQDGRFTFEDLANLAERVRVDFGAKIAFDEEFGLDALKPGSADTANGEMLGSALLARRGFAVARIRYASDGRQDPPSGTLIYFKSTLTADLSADVYGYKNANPAFPHETTGDQFFDEVQFEAYRELGYYLGWQWLEANETKQFWKPEMPSAPPMIAEPSDDAPTELYGATAQTRT